MSNMILNAADWSLVKLRDCAQFQEGYVNPSQTVPEYFGTEVKWLRAVDLNDTYVWNTSRCLSQSGFRSAGKSALLFKPNTLAISKSGTIGRLGILKDYMCGNRAVINITPKNDNCDTRFIFYSLLHHRAEIIELASGSVQKNLYISVLGNIELQLPPIPEQQAISEVLGALDDKIELNRQMAELLEEIAQTLFKSWFNDFEPVKAKSDGREPEGLNVETADLFPREFCNSELGSIPKGWAVGVLDDVVNLNPSRMLKKAVEAPYLDMANVPVAGHRPTDWILRAFSSGTKFMNGDTLLARITPCLENGKTALCDFLDPEEVGWGSTEFIVMEPRAQVPPEFVYLLARSPMFRRFAIQSMSGTSGRQRVQTDRLRQYKLAIPDGRIYGVFGAMVKPLFQRIKNASEQNRILSSLRDALLPKLLSGQLRVLDAEVSLKSVSV